MESKKLFQAIGLGLLGIGAAVGAAILLKPKQEVVEVIETTEEVIETTENEEEV